MPGGFGNRGVEGKILAANYARLNKKPYLGICLGMQVGAPGDGPAPGMRRVTAWGYGGLQGGLEKRGGEAVDAGPNRGGGRAGHAGPKP